MHMQSRQRHKGFEYVDRRAGWIDRRVCRLGFAERSQGG